jgi:hypothetical protein
LKGQALKGEKPRRRPATRGPRTIERTGSPEVDDLKERILDLEGRVRALAVSRRVLISLLVSSDKKRKLEVAGLQVEIENLRNRNAKSARAVAVRDAAIHRLRYQLGVLCGEIADGDGQALASTAKAGLAATTRENPTREGGAKHGGSRPDRRSEQRSR